MRKIIIVALLLITAAIFLSAADTRPVVKIGVLLPLSGDLVNFGLPLRDSLMLKIDELKKQPTKFAYQFVIEDCKDKPKDSLLAAQKLLTFDHADFLIGLWGINSQPVVPLVERHRVPFIDLLTWNENIANGSYSFILAASARREFGLAIKAAKELGLRRVAVIRARDYDNEYASLINHEELKMAGLILTDEEVFNPGLTDFVPLIIKIRESKPDIVFNCSYDPEIYIIERRLHEMGMTCPVVAFETYDAMTDNEFIQGRWYVTSAQTNNDFAAKYKARTKRDPDYATGYMYDAVGLAIEAFEHASSVSQEKPSGAQVAAYLRQVKDYQGVVGPISSNSRGVMDTYPQLMRIVNKKAVPTTEAEILKLYKKN